MAEERDCLVICMLATDRALLAMVRHDSKTEHNGTLLRMDQLTVGLSMSKHRYFFKSVDIIEVLLIISTTKSQAQVAQNTS